MTPPKTVIKLSDFLTTLTEPLLKMVRAAGFEPAAHNPKNAHQNTAPILILLAVFFFYTASVEIDTYDKFRQVPTLHCHILS